MIVFSRFIKKKSPNESFRHVRLAKPERLSPSLGIFSLILVRTASAHSTGRFHITTVPFTFLLRLALGLLSKDLTEILGNVRGKANAVGQDAIRGMHTSGGTDSASDFLLFLLHRCLFLSPTQRVRDQRARPPALLGNGTRDQTSMLSLPGYTGATSLAIPFPRFLRLAIDERARVCVCIRLRLPVLCIDRG